MFGTHFLYWRRARSTGEFRTINPQNKEIVPLQFSTDCTGAHVYSASFLFYAKCVSHVSTKSHKRGQIENIFIDNMEKKQKQNFLLWIIAWRCLIPVNQFHKKHRSPGINSFIIHVSIHSFDYEIFNINCNCYYKRNYKGINLC